MHMPCLDHGHEIGNDYVDGKIDRVVELHPSYVSANFLFVTKFTFDPTKSATQDSIVVGSHRILDFRTHGDILQTLDT
jgi:hypothetical protein